MSTRNARLIHIFALLHFAASAVCSLLGADDSLLLTALTITLTLLLCLREDNSLDFTILCLVLVNILGYFLGSLFAWLFGKFIASTLWVKAISTLITTEIIGWTFLWMFRHFLPNNGGLSESERTLRTNWLVATVVFVFLVRMFISFVLTGSGGSAASEFLGNPAALLFCLAGSLLFLLALNRSNDQSSSQKRVISLSLYFISMTLLAAIFVGLGLPGKISFNMDAAHLIRLIAVALAANATIFSLVYLIYYSNQSHLRAEREREKAEKARYQYLLLKQQMNPHFLFNSLNVLDALLMEAPKEEASHFLHQLAALYRYMIKNENEDVVTLREEMEFAGSFADLMKTRWQEGLEFILSVREEDMTRYVVPCSLQVCIENAIKHNSVSAENPLRVRVSSDGKFLSVSNPLQRRPSTQESTGVGLTYVRQQYKTTSGKDVVVTETDTTYTIQLPLL